MKTLRYYFRLTVAFILRFKGLLIIGALVGILIYLSINLVTPYFQDGDERVIGLSGRFYTEDLPDEILDKLSEGLTDVNSSGIPEPAVASSWETPDRGNTWIFNIKEIHWHDGSRVVSSEIKYNFSDVEIDRPDDRTIVFRLDDPYSPFPVVVSKPIFKQGLLGTGDWRVENLTLSQGFAQEIVLIDKQETRVRYKFYPNESQAKIGFKLGEVDEIEGLYNPSPFDEWETATVEHNVKNDQIVTVFFDTQSDKFKDNKPLRQSLSYAINKDELSEHRAISPINPGSWAYNPQVKSYDYDLDRAQELIEDIPQEERERVIVLTTTPVLLDVAEKIKNHWEAVGLTVNISVSTSPVEGSHAFLTIFEIPQDPDQYQIWHSTQESNNISNYASDRIDGLLEQGRVQLILEDRKKTYIDFQRFLLEDAPAVFLYHPTYYDVARK